MNGFRVARYLDYEAGSLLLLTDDFSQAHGEILAMSPDFSWWLDSRRRITGFSIAGLDRPGPCDPELRGFRTYRVSVPQLRLSRATVYEVAVAARRHFVEGRNGSFVQEAYQRASVRQERGDPVERLNEWLCLYHVYGHIDGLYWMGCAFIDLDMPAEAIRWLEKYAAHHLQDAWGQRQLGYAHYLLGNLAEARSHLQQALSASSSGEEGETDAAGLLAAIDAPPADPA
ncbi:MAG: tetratricopeptide repeat protein [Gaiellales bacterium]|nr:MAG: tetratricopeptide repeat protein [Gaiellales bacterium]